MRIALVGPYRADDGGSRGGVETSFANLVAGLAAIDGLQPNVLTFASGLAAEERSAVAGVPVRRLPQAPRLSNLTLHRREVRTLARALADIEPDVVHAQDALQYGYVSLKAKPRAPVVVSIHGIVREEVRYVRGRAAHLRTRVAGVALERYCVRNSRFLVSPTRYAQRVFAGEIRGRIWEIPNPIADRFFLGDAQPEPGRILYTGSLIPRKRLLDLVEALPTVRAAAPHVHLRVAGGGGEHGYADAVRARVRELGLADAVTFLGGVTDDTLLEEYRRAWLLVLPSGVETSPMVIAEAMAAGVPVVATPVGGIPSLVDDGVTGNLFEVGDVASLADRIGAVVRDPELREQLGARARARAEEGFRTSAVAGRFAEMYEAIRAEWLTGRPRPA